MSKGRVAVIAVHGVADQAAGQTAAAVVELMVASAPKDSRWRAVDSQDVVLQVPPLAPDPQHGPVAPARQRAGATPHAEDRRPGKAFMQSWRSDFHHDAWHAPRTRKPLAALREALHPSVGAHRHATDRGIEVSRYLLKKNIDNGARPESYATTVVGMERTQDGRTLRVDVHELYWADLSRLSGSMPRIVSELFTLVFRLSKLGRETVEEARGAQAARTTTHPLRAAAWACTTVLQSALDWLLVNVLALLFTQLAWMTLLLFVIGLVSVAAARASHAAWFDVHLFIVEAFALLELLRAGYRHAGAAPGTPLARDGVAVVRLVAAGLAATCPWWAPAALPWITTALALWMLNALNETVLAIADDRFPFVRTAGRWMWGFVVVVLVAAAGREALSTGNDWKPLWEHAVLFTTELLLFCVKAWWIVVGGLLVPWFVAGLVAGRGAGHAAGASIATGRVGFAMSLCMFVAVTMSIWAMLNSALDWSVDGTGYVPCILEIDVRETSPRVDTHGTFAQNVCPLAPWDEAAATWPRTRLYRDMPSAGFVLEQRYANSTAGFSMVAILLVALLGYLAVVFAPSILAELKLLIDRAGNAVRRHVARKAARASAQRAADLREALRLRTRELGRWLTLGMRALDGVVLAITAAGIGFGLVVAILFVDSIWQFLPDRNPLMSFAVWSRQRSATLLEPFIFSATGLGAALSLFGGALSRTLPSLRAPLDVALDVDNHFREFPRSNIARARIFSRYAALLRHVGAQGYERIVIVAHSQGTVISAELLRLLSSESARAPMPGQTPRLGTTALPPIDLLTLGCPLRQLYNARFPTLYGWVLARRDGVTGPRADDIGAARWFNGYCSGDYVGRWLWSDAAHRADLEHPTLDDLAERPFGRADMYAPFDPEPPSAAHLDPARELEVCLGLGAHTHYFERDQAMVAWMIDHLVGTGARGRRRVRRGAARAVRSR